jgi:integrase/recombinase XerD
MNISTYPFYEIAPSQTSANTDEKLITMWLHGKSQTSQKTYNSTVKQFLAFVGKGLRELKLEDVQLWSSSLEMRYSATTVKNKVNAVKSLLSFGQKIGYLQFNVGSAVTTPNAKDTLSYRILSHEDVLKLIKATSCQRDRIMLSVAYKCGLRRAEVLGLTWSDLQPRGDGGQATVYGKGGKTRTVLIPRKLWGELMSLPRSRKTEAVFVSRNGGSIKPTRLHYIIKEASREAGISEKASSHWLRHSHATEAIERGCDLHLLQQSLGHSSLAVTSKYLHTRPDQSSSQFFED